MSASADKIFPNCWLKILNGKERVPPPPSIAENLELVCRKLHFLQKYNSTYFVLTQKGVGTLHHPLMETFHEWGFLKPSLKHIRHNQLFTCTKLLVANKLMFVVASPVIPFKFTLACVYVYTCIRVYVFTCFTVEKTVIIFILAWGSSQKYQFFGLREAIVKKTRIL